MGSAWPNEDPFRQDVVDVISTTGTLSQERSTALIQLCDDGVVDRSAVLRCSEELIPKLLTRVQGRAAAVSTLKTDALSALETVLSLLAQLGDLQEGEDLASKLLLIESPDAVPEFAAIERTVFQLARAQTAGPDDGRMDVALLYRLVAVLLGAVYARSRHALDAVNLDRSISNLDAALVFVPEDASLHRFSQAVRRLQAEVQQIKTLLLRIEAEEDRQGLQGTLCGTCFDLQRIHGYHDDEEPVLRMFFSDVLRMANKRCYACTIVRDATASMYATVGIPWQNILRLVCVNLSAMAWWMNKRSEDFDSTVTRAEIFYGKDAPLQVMVQPKNRPGDGQGEGSQQGIPVFQLYALQGGPRRWPIIGLGSHVHPHVDSHEGWAHVEQWITTCQSSHEECRQEAEEDQLLPTRIISVGADTGPPPRLHVPAPGERGRYAALSHCWGTVMPPRTTKSALTAFQQCLPPSCFPPTFRDALLTCRRLNIPYLWIDSVCIIQDDTADWEAEAPKMGQVYHNAFLTIAAASAADSAAGFLRPRSAVTCSRRLTTMTHSADDTVEEVSIFVRDWFSYDPWIATVGDGPGTDPARRAPHSLDTRAWTLQEALLSRRVLRFAAHETVWQCAATHRSESLPHDLLYKEAPRVLQLEKLRRRGGEDEGFFGRADNPRLVWEEALPSYTARKITYASDWLPAISGFAAALAGVTGMTYVGGMWKELLGGTLCWRVPSGIRAERHEEYYAPSWSWASLMGRVQMASSCGAEALLTTEVVDVTWSLATRSPYALLKDASLTIKGLMLEVLVGPSVNDKDDDDDDGHFVVWFPTQLSHIFGKRHVTRTDAYLDIIDEKGNAPDLKDGLSLSILFIQAAPGTGGFSWIAGLLLVPSQSQSRAENSQQTYRRIGTGWVLMHCDQVVDGFGLDENSPASRVADALISEGYEKTVTIV